jgi:hypothetical protein
VQLAGELAALAGNGAGRPGVLIVIDQAEELLTRTGAHEQQAFLELLAGALGEDSPIWAVATARSEFLSTAPDRAGLGEAVDDPLVIEPLSRARLAEVIARPAQRAGLDLEPGLVERMVEDTAGGDALSLLGCTLHQLYQRAGSEGRITAEDYEAVGGVIGALRHRADRLTDELRRGGLGNLVLPTLLRLAAVTGDEPPTRRRVRCSAFSTEERVVVDAFVDAPCWSATRIPPIPAPTPWWRSRTRRCYGSGPRCGMRSRPTAPCCGCARNWNAWPPTGSRNGATTPTCCAAGGWPPSTTGPPRTPASSAHLNENFWTPAADW